MKTFMAHRTAVAVRSAAAVAVLALAPAMAALSVSPAAAQPTEDTVATDMGDLVVHPIHHAAMMLTWNGLNILIDPAPPPGGGGGGDVTAEYTAIPTPDLILVTDIHGDHMSADILAALSGDAPIVVPQAVADQLPEALSARIQVLANGESTTIEGIGIEAVAMYNLTEDRLQFHDKGRGNGYVLTIGGKRIYISGDTEDIPEMRALENIDVAFICMNLPYTMTVEQAADAVREFQPVITYPYHYGMSDVNAFSDMVGDASDVRLLKWY